MVKKIPYFLFACFFALLLSSCEECEEFEYEGSEIAPYELLTDGVWDMEFIEFTEYEDGQPGNVWSEEFGFGTDNGICTFDFDEENTCLIVDVGSEESNTYVLYEDGNLMIGEQLYEIRTIDEETLELAVIEYACEGDDDDDGWFGGDDDDDEGEDDDDDDGDDDDDDGEEEREGEQEVMHFARIQ